VIKLGRLDLTPEAFPPNWQALQVYAFYRFILSGALLIAIKFNFLPSLITDIDEPLFVSTTQAYISFGIIALLISFIKKPSFFYQAYITIWFDIIFLVLLMHAGGGILSGIGILMIIVVAAHSVLLPGRLSLLSAAFASSVILTEQVFSQFTQAFPKVAYTQAGVLGATIFVTSIGLQLISEKAIKSQILAKERGLKLAIIGQLNAHVVSHMQSGVIVFNESQSIELINIAALKMMGTDAIPLYVHGLPQALQSIIESWRKEPLPFREPIKLYNEGPPVKLTFHSLGEKKTDVLIFINDLTQEAKHAQDIKLASLGKLTANIAHELRNPLAVASHASQLLAESKSFSKEEVYLIDVIYQHCNRMNTVIRNVLSLSTQKKSEPKEIKLLAWLSEFTNEFQAQGIKDKKIDIQIQSNDLTITIDPTQFRQILVNLFENGLRYSYKKNKHAILKISAYLSEGGTFTFVDIADDGAGIPENMAKHIFEPFFTTDESGSGLGLYIAKELAELNGAQLLYVPTQSGCLFRLIFKMELGENAWNAQTH
jgi:two-component system, NtrC family, sensor histidine kinase PilS